MEKMRFISGMYTCHGERVDVQGIATSDTGAQIVVYRRLSDRCLCRCALKEWKGVMVYSNAEGPR